MRRLWAVSRTALREAVRTRTAAVVLVAIVAVVALSPVLLRGTGKLVDLVQLVLSYSVSAVGFLLSVLTIFLSASTLSGDLREKRIETIVTKPIARWQIIAGKWLAVMLLNVVLLAVSGGVTYGLVRYVVGRPSLAKTADERRRLTNEIYTARHTVNPTRPTKQIEQFITDEISYKRRRNLLEEDFDEAAYRRKRRQELWISYNTLPPGFSSQHKFEGVAPGHGDEQISVRYKLVAVGPSEAGAREESIYLEWIISPDPVLPPRTGISVLEPGISLGDFHEFAVPASLVNPSGELYVTCTNLSNVPGAGSQDVHAAFPAVGGVQLLYRAGTFEGNFARTLLLILVRLAFLSALALAASSLLSFPVASLFVVFVFVCALSIGHFVALSAPIGGTDQQPIYQTPFFSRVLFKAIAAVVPNFGRYDGAGELATGRLVPWRLVVRGALVVGVIYGGVAMALGCLYFRGRELGEEE